MRLMTETTLTVKQWANQNDIHSRDDLNAAIEEFIYDGCAPALCTEGCEVETDGRCMHGNPSILIAVGMI